MDNPKCPKCGTEVAKHWNNKRRQHVGKCGPCGKLVYLGKATDPEEGKEKGEAKEAPAAKKRGTVEPPPPSGRRAAVRKPGPGATGKPQQQNKQPVQRPEADNGDPIWEFLRRIWK